MEELFRKVQLCTLKYSSKIKVIVAAWMPFLWTRRNSTGRTSQWWLRTSWHFTWLATRCNGETWCYDRQWVLASASRRFWRLWGIGYEWQEVKCCRSGEKSVGPITCRQGVFSVASLTSSFLLIHLSCPSSMQYISIRRRRQRRDLGDVISRQITL